MVFEKLDWNFYLILDFLEESIVDKMLNYFLIFYLICLTFLFNLLVLFDIKFFIFFDLVLN